MKEEREEPILNIDLSYYYVPHVHSTMHHRVQTPADPRILHARALKSPNTPTSIFNNLITFYSKSSLKLNNTSLLHIFSQIPSPNVISWTALISAHSNSFLSLHHFLSMLRHPTLPNDRTLASLFKTCAALSALSFGLALHALSVKLSLSSLRFSASALINFYCKCRLPVHARKVFDEMTERDEVCYTAVIVGLAQNSRAVDALSVFAEMKGCNVPTTMHSVSGALRAAAEMAALEQCRVIHGHSVVVGFTRNVVIGSGLVDGYGKAGHVGDARRVFDELLPALNIVGWNAMMAGYAQKGDKDSVLELCNAMRAKGLVPDEYSFLAVLTAFGNAGLAFESKRLIEKMKIDHGVDPSLEHYTCLVHAMGRAGQLEEAERIAMTMPFEPDAAVWRALLASCACHGAANMAWLVSRRLLELDPNDDSAYAIAANVLSDKGKWSEAAELRKLTKNRRVKKGGMSLIEVKGKLYVFLAGDRRHERTEEVYSKLAELIKEIEKLGYVPVWDEAVHEAGEKEKREALWHHSTKLAVAFGLVSGKDLPGKPLRIVNNKRICWDCHKALKYISRVAEREVIVRDVNRYHRFSNGSCSCGEI